MSNVTECLYFFPTQDVLHNDNLKLDWMFQLSIAFDVARVSIAYYFNEHRFQIFKKVDVKFNEVFL